MADPERQRHVIQAFLDSARDEETLARMSNEDLATLLAERVIYECKVLTPEMSLLEEVEKRLLRDPHFKRDSSTRI